MVPEKSTAWIPTLTGNDAMFFIHLQMAYTRFWNFDRLLPLAS